MKFTLENDVTCFDKNSALAQESEEVKEFYMRLHCVPAESKLYFEEIFWDMLLFQDAFHSTHEEHRALQYQLNQLAGK